MSTAAPPTAPRPQPTAGTPGSAARADPRPTRGEQHHVRRQGQRLPCVPPHGRAGGAAPVRPVGCADGDRAAAGAARQDLTQPPHPPHRRRRAAQDRPPQKRRRPCRCRRPRAPSRARTRTSGKRFACSTPVGVHPPPNVRPPSSPSPLPPPYCTRGARQYRWTALYKRAQNSR